MIQQTWLDWRKLPATCGAPVAPWWMMRTSGMVLMYRVPSGYVKIATENYPIYSWFTELKIGDFPVRKLLVYKCWAPTTSMFTRHLFIHPCLRPQKYQGRGLCTEVDAPSGFDFGQCPWAIAPAVMVGWGRNLGGKGLYMGGCWKLSSWWFGTFFVFHNIWDNPSHWLFFQRVETTNQLW